MFHVQLEAYFRNFDLDLWPFENRLTMREILYNLLLYSCLVHLTRCRLLGSFDKHILNWMLISKCIEVNEGSRTSVKQNLLIAVKFKAMSQIIKI